MPVFSASSVPSVVGLYVNNFIDPSGQLSNLLVTSGGTGYDPLDPPTIEISGGSGSGAEIVPVILNGELIGAKFEDTQGSGYLRGQDFSSVPSFIFTGNSGTGATLTCSLSQNTTILGNSSNENSLLSFCKENRINYLLLDNLKFIDWTSDTSVDLSKPGKNILSDFLVKAKASGITQIAAITDGGYTDVDYIIDYQNSRTSSNQRFDTITLFKEFWNGDGDINQYVTKLTYLKEESTGSTPYNLNIEVLIGWPEYSDMIQIIPHVDRIILTDYSSVPVPNYSYTSDRLINKIGSACTFLNKTVELMPIFSSERINSPWNSESEYMGLYYSSNTIYDSWYGWALAESGYTYLNHNLGSFNYESDILVRDNLDPVGYAIFNQYYLRTSNPSTGLTFNCYISSNSPLTGISSSNSLILSANPEGYSYIWYPSGETTSSINVTGSGSYYVTITNYSGISCTTSAVTVSFLTGNSCTPTITYTGSTTIYSGNSLTLNSSSGSTYSWYPYGESTQSISVSGSGNYFVTVDSGTGCTGNSQYVEVNVLPCETTIGILSSGLIEIQNNYTNYGSFSAVTGTTVILSAMTTGSSILWSTTETTQSITADTTNTYTLTVTNENCIATGSVISNFYSCLATISYTGNTTFNSGETITLCSNSADSYLWFPNGETTQCITVGTGGTYYVENTYSSGCTAVSNSIIINVLTGNCSSYILAGDPLYYSSGISLSSVTLTASSGSSYTWYPGGETGQTLSVTGSGIYYVTVDNGYGCSSTSSIVVSFNDWVPGSGYWTEDNKNALLNSNLSYSETTFEELHLPWIEYKLNVLNISENKYFIFFKLKSSDGKDTGLRLAVNGIDNFFPITGINDTTMGWYRFQIDDIKFSHFIEGQTASIYVQMNNTSCQIEQFALSSNPDFIPGPYPNYSYV